MCIRDRWHAVLAVVRCSTRTTTGIRTGTAGSGWRRCTFRSFTTWRPRYVTLRFAGDFCAVLRWLFAAVTWAHGAKSFATPCDTHDCENALKLNYSTTADPPLRQRLYISLQLIPHDGENASKIIHNSLSTTANTPLKLSTAPFPRL